MATLNETVLLLVQDLQRDSANADVWVNGDETLGYVATGGEIVPSIQKMVVDFENRTDFSGEYVGGGAEYIRGETFNNEYEALVVTSDFTSTNFDDDAPNYKVSFRLTDMIEDALDAAIAANASAAAAALSLYEFNGVWLGSAVTDPALDLNGDPLTGGEAYLNSATTPPEMRIYDLGTDTWHAPITDTATSASNALNSENAAAASAAAVDDALMSLPLLRATFDNHGVLNDGSQNAIDIPNGGQIDLGLFNFTLGNFEFVLTDYTPSSSVVLAQQVSGLFGWKLILNPAGTLRLQIGNGVDFTTLEYYSTVSVGLENNSGLWVTLQGVRSGNLSFFVNGGKLGDSVDMSSSSAETIITRSSVEVLPSEVGRTFGQFILVNFAQSDSEIEALYMNPDQWRDWGVTSFTRNYIFDADYSEFNTTGGAWLFGQAIGGYSDVGQFTVTSASEVKQPSTSSANDLPVGTFQEVVSGAVYVPSTNDVVDGLRIYETTESASYFFADETISNDTWVGFQSEQTVSNETTSRLRFELLDGGSTTINDAAGDDTFSVRNITRAVKGVFCVVDFGSGGPQKRDLSGRGLHGYMPIGAVETLPAREYWVEGQLEFTTGSSAAQSIGGGAALVIDGAYVNDFLVWGATGAENWQVGDGSDVGRWVAEFADTTAPAKQTIANTSNDGSNRSIEILPTDGAATPEARDDTAHILVHCINTNGVN